MDGPGCLQLRCPPGSSISSSWPTPSWLCAPFCSPLLLLSCFQVVRQGPGSDAVPTLWCWETQLAPHGAHSVEALSPRPEPVRTLQCTRDTQQFPPTLLRSSWNCGNQRVSESQAGNSHAHPVPEDPHSSRASPQALLLPCSLWAVWPSAGGLQQPLEPLYYWPHSSTKWLLSRGELTRVNGSAVRGKVTLGEQIWGAHVLSLGEICPQ